jgi:hypothetical protein
VGRKQQQETEMARAILQYLQQHPDAKDTIDGIAQWWLLKQWTERKYEEIETGIAQLVTRGLLIERRRPGLPPYYWLNRAKQDEIARIIEATIRKTDRARPGGRRDTKRR